MALEQLASEAAPDITESMETTGDLATHVPVGFANDVGFAYTLASNPFGHYCVPDTMAEGAEAQLIAQAGVPESSTLQLISRKLGSGDLITGCTGIGSFLPAFHEALAPSAMIHAFEPEDTAFAASSFTARINGLEQVNLHQTIAGKRNRDFPSTRLVDRGPEADISETPDEPITFVQMKRLDAVVPQGRYVSVIHLNSHNLEMPAILGAKRLVHDSAPMIVMKASKVRTQRFFLSCLQAHFPDLDYQFAGTMDDNAIYVPLNRA